MMEVDLFTTCGNLLCLIEIFCLMPITKFGSTCIIYVRVDAEKVV